LTAKKVKKLGLTGKTKFLTNNTLCYGFDRTSNETISGSEGEDFFSYLEFRVSACGGTNCLTNIPTGTGP
jgi:hypothetical protein